MNGSHRYVNTSHVATFPKPGPLSPSGESAQFRIPSSWRIMRQA